MSIRIGPGTTISGFQHPGGGGGGGGGGSFNFGTPTTSAVDPFGGSGPSYTFDGINQANWISTASLGINLSGQDWCIEGIGRAHV